MTNTPGTETPIELAIATPDEPFDAEPLLAFDGRSVTWR